MRRTALENLEYPKPDLFSIGDLEKLNPNFIKITLRVRLSNLIEAGTIKHIDSISGADGRAVNRFKSIS